MTVAPRIQNKPKLESFISKDYFSVSSFRTVGESVALLRQHKEDFQNKFSYLYVTDESNKLVGVLRTRDLLLEDFSKEIRIVMDESVVSVSIGASMEKLIELFHTHSFLAVPVVDSTHQLSGIITREKLELYLPKKIQPYFQKFNVVKKEEIEGGRIYNIVLKRLPWLLISVSSGLVCSYILGIFIGKIESIIALILFVPVILGLAGNVGTQLARVTARGLEEGKLSVTKLIRILFKEVVIGSITGLCAFLLITIIALLWRRYPIEGIALGVSIVAVTLVSGILGIVLPITFKTFRIGANFASGLFLLLICDMVALVLYFLISLSLVSPMLVIS